METVARKLRCITCKPCVSVLVLLALSLNVETKRSSPSHNSGMLVLSFYCY